MKSGYKKEWKVVECGTSKDCWCGVIVLKSLKKYNHEDENDKNVIIDPGWITKEFAKYVVKLHNAEIKRKLKGEVNE